jgi:RNA polymerase sigma-32 factor
MADNPETLQEIGNKFNITRERARQIEKQALKKVQLALPYLKPDK